METQTNSGNKLSAIDRALAAAKARKAARDAEEGSKTETVVAVKQPLSLSPEVQDAVQARAHKADKTNEQKEAKAAAKAEKAAKKAAKLAADDEAKKITHLKKVERAKSKLPKLDSQTELSFNELTSTLSAYQLHVLSQYLQIHNRAMATIRSNASKPHPVGSTVKIVGGEPKFIGMIGKVIHSHKLRAKVEVPGQKKLVYIYSADAEQFEAEASAVG